MAERENIKAVWDSTQTLIAVMKDKVNNEEDVTDIKDTIEDAFNKYLDFVRLYLIQAKDRLYGEILSGMETAVDFNMNGPIGIKLKGKNVLCSFVLKVNPLHTAGFTIREMNGLVVREIMKIIDAHPSTFAEKNPSADSRKHEHLEKASDASSSEIVLKEIRDVDSRGITLPKSYTKANVDIDTNMSTKNNSTIDYYFNVLEKHDKTPDTGGSSNVDPNSMSTPENGQGTDPHDWESDWQGGADALRSACKDLVKKAWDNCSTSRGYTPGCVQSMIEALLRPPEINWKQQLRRYIGSLPYGRKPTKTRLNRRQPERTDLSGTLQDRIIKVVLVYDTSGSVTDEMLSYTLNETFNILKDYKTKITIIECDAEVNKVYQAKKASEVNINITGRGGTMFTPAIEYVNGTTNDPRYANDKLKGHFSDALMIFFTDGYGEYEIPKPKTRRNLWVIYDDVRALSVKEPYGEVKSLSTDKDWKNRK